MGSRRQLLIWIGAAVAASALLAGVLEWEHESAQSRWSSFLVGDPHMGARLFQEKGCAHCHAVNGAGGELAPDLGYEPPPSGIDKLVTAMWSHAPRSRAFSRISRRSLGWIWRPCLIRPRRKSFMDASGPSWRVFASFRWSTCRKFPA